MKNSYAYPLSVGLVVAFILAVLSWLALQEIDRRVAVANEDKLQSLLDATEQAYHSWFRQQQADVSIWAGTPEITGFAKALLSEYSASSRIGVAAVPSGSPVAPGQTQQYPQLLSSPLQPALNDWLKPVLSFKAYQGYFIIAPDGISLASSRQENIGTLNLLWGHNGFLEQVLAGHTMVSLPQMSDVPLPDAQGRLRPGLPTMFTAAPIRDEAGNTIAALAFHIDPDSDFTRIFTQTRIHAGEGLAFNRKGLLISHSRFEEQLRLQGLLTDEQGSMLNIDLRKRRDQRGQTQQVGFYQPMADGSEEAMNVEGYLNYRGAYVIGAWRWLPEYGLGLAVEQEHGAAYAVLQAVRGVMWVLVGAVLVLMAALAYLFVSGRQKVVESESRLSGIIEMADDAIISIDEAQKIVLFNKAAEKTFGYTEAEILGQPLSRLMPPRHRKVHHQHVENFAKSRDGKIMTAGDGKVFGLRKNGEEFPMVSTLTKQIVSGKLIQTVALRDISQQLQAEVDLRKERDRARRYLDTVEAIMLALDTRGRVQLINRKGCEVLDIAEKNVVGQDWFELAVPEADRDKARAEFEDYIQGNLLGGRYHEDVVLAHNDGQHCIAWHSSLIVDEEGTITGMLSSGLDVSDTKRSAQERDRLQRQLMHAQKVEAIGQLTGGIAHDFNNMLASIRGYTELALALVSKDSQSKLPEYLRQVHQTCLRAAELVSKLLAFSRGAESELKSQSLSELVDASFGMLDSVLPSTIEVTKNFVPGLPNVMADATQLDQVVVNLCINARDAMDGKGRLDVSLRLVTAVREECISCHKPLRGEFVELSVKDSGSGIAPEMMDKLFNPFFTSKEVGKGTGMGLAMVHGIVHGHGGHVRVVNAPEGGAEFLLYFPVAEYVAHELEGQAMTDKGIDVPVEPAQKRILLVDDEEAVAGMLSEVLRYAGFEVESYTESLKALLKFEENPAAFDLLLTDQTMPHMTGAELAQAVLIARPDLPVILCTGYSAEVDEAKALAMGISAYLPKPLNTGQLMQTIDRLVNERAGGVAEVSSPSAD
jgi:PAS domain S-box-containing protein